MSNNSRLTSKVKAQVIATQRYVAILFGYDYKFVAMVTFTIAYCKETFGEWIKA